MTEPRPRFLAPSARRPPRIDESLGFADSPHEGMRDEPECIGAAIVDAYADLHRTYDQLRHNLQVMEMREIRRALTAEQRMADLRRRAKAERLDMSSEFHVMRKMLARGNEKAALARLEAAELRLDRPTQQAA
jgi:hypothetical protein